MTIIRSSTCWTSSSRSISTSTRSTVEASAATRSACAGSDSHLPEPARDFGVAQLGLDDLRRHEVLPDEGAQTLAQLVLLALDDRGVRDRYPQRVLEQRRHREPVGQRTDHARFRRGGDITGPRACAVGLGPLAEEEQHSGPDQETQRDDLHSPQATAAFRIGGGVGAGQRFGETRPLRRGRRKRPQPAASGVWSVCHTYIIRYNPECWPCRRGSRRHPP